MNRILVARSHDDETHGDASCECGVPEQPAARSDAGPHRAARWLGWVYIGRWWLALNLRLDVLGVNRVRLLRPIHAELVFEVVGTARVGYKSRPHEEIWRNTSHATRR